MFITRLRVGGTVHVTHKPAHLDWVRAQIMHSTPSPRVYLIFKDRREMIEITLHRRTDFHFTARTFVMSQLSLVFIVWQLYLFLGTYNWKEKWLSFHLQLKDSQSLSKIILRLFFVPCLKAKHLSAFVSVYIHSLRIV